MFLFDFFFIFLCFYCRLIVACDSSLVFILTIKATILLQSDREVTSNSYSSICFIRPKILGILSILGLSLV